MLNTTTSAAHNTDDMQNKFSSWLFRVSTHLTRFIEYIAQEGLFIGFPEWNNLRELDFNWESNIVNTCITTKLLQILVKNVILLLFFIDCDLSFNLQKIVWTIYPMSNIIIHRVSKFETFRVSAISINFISPSRFLIFLPVTVSLRSVPGWLFSLLIGPVRTSANNLRIPASTTGQKLAKSHKLYSSY